MSNSWLTLLFRLPGTYIFDAGLVCCFVGPGHHSVPLGGMGSKGFPTTPWDYALWRITYGLLGINLSNFPKVSSEGVLGNSWDG